MSRSWLAFLRRHWLAGIGLLAIGGIVVAVNPIELLHVLQHTDARSVALMLPVTLVLYLVRALGWWVELRRIGVPISPQRAVVVAFAGQATIFIPGGDLGRAALLELSGAAGHDPGEITGTIAFQELSYLLLLAIATIPAAIRYPATGAIVLAVIAFEATVLVVIAWLPAYEWAIGIVVRWRPLRRFEHPMRNVRPAFVKMLSPGTSLLVLLSNVLTLALAFLLFELALHAVGAGRVGYANAAFIYALAHVAGALSMLPGGLGVYEGVMTAFISLNGATPSQGAVAALLFRGFNDVLMALIGIGAGALLRRRPVPTDLRGARSRTETT